MLELANSSAWKAEGVKAARGRNSLPPPYLIFFKINKKKVYKHQKKVILKI